MKTTLALTEKSYKIISEFMFVGEFKSVADLMEDAEKVCGQVEVKNKLRAQGRTATVSLKVKNSIKQKAFIANCTMVSYTHAMLIEYRKKRIYKFDKFKQNAKQATYLKSLRVNKL